MVCEVLQVAARALTELEHVLAVDIDRVEEAAEEARPLVLEVRILVSGDEPAVDARTDLLPDPGPVAFLIVLDHRSHRLRTGSR
jgi:hypothetical protein